MCVYVHMCVFVTHKRAVTNFQQICSIRRWIALQETLSYRNVRNVPENASDFPRNAQKTPIICTASQSTGAVRFVLIYVGRLPT